MSKQDPQFQIKEKNIQFKLKLQYNKKAFLCYGYKRMLERSKDFVLSFCMSHFVLQIILSQFLNF